MRTLMISLLIVFLMAGSFFGGVCVRDFRAAAQERRRVPVRSTQAATRVSVSELDRVLKKLDVLSRILSLMEKVPDDIRKQLGPAAASVASAIAEEAGKIK